MKIVAAVDRSQFSDKVAEMVVRLAPRNSSLLLINVAPREPDMLGKQIMRKVITDPVPEDLRDRRELLDRLCVGFRKHRIKCETLLIRGNPGPTIVQETQRWGGELVVMGSHGRGQLYRKLMGSVAQSVLDSRCVPVLIIPSARDEE